MSTTTEITNAGDASFHRFVGAEAPRDTRIALKFTNGNNLLRDFLKTAHNQVEAFWIPGDFKEGSGSRSSLSLDLTAIRADQRHPYVSRVAHFFPRVHHYR